MIITAKFQTHTATKNSGIEWTGRVPETWSIVPLRHLSRIHSGNGFPHELQGDKSGTIPFLKVSDFQKNERFVSTANNLVSERVITNRGWNVVPKGSLVTAKIGEALRKNHRNITGASCVIDNNCIAFEPKGIDESYFYYLHKVIDFDWFVNPGAVPSISVQRYRSQRVAVPPLPEQRAIAAFLDNKCAKIDEAARIKEKQIALLRERRQILIQHAVTRGLNPDAPMKDSGIDWIGQIPAHWEAAPLKRLFRERNERTRTGAETLFSLRMIEGLVPHDDVSDKPISDAELVDYKIIYPGQMVMNRMRASIGLFGFASRKGLVSPDYAIFDMQKGLFGAFYLNLFKTEQMGVRFRLSSRGLGTGSSGFMRLYTDDFGAISVPRPSIEEQSEIVEYIDIIRGKIGDAVKLKQGHIAALKEYKKSLINSAVTGKIKVI